MLTDEQGNIRATYGYTPYGENDESMFSGVDKPDSANPDKEIYNPYRYAGKRWDANTKSYDLGFRNYFPEQGRFMTPDSYDDPVKHKGLIMDPANQNLYGYTDGNPISYLDPDGHYMEGSDHERAVFHPSTGRMAISGSKRPGENGHYQWNHRKKDFIKIKQKRSRPVSHTRPSRPKSTTKKELTWSKALVKSFRSIDSGYATSQQLFGLIGFVGVKGSGFGYNSLVSNTVWRSIKPEFGLRSC